VIYTYSAQNITVDSSTFNGGSSSDPGISIVSSANSALVKINNCQFLNLVNGPALDLQANERSFATISNTKVIF
jgi:hypothetical protein